MKLNLTCGAVLCAAVAMTAPKAGAVTAADDTLLLCFRATAGTGSQTDLYVDLGTVSNYGPNEATTFNLNADLSAIYGSSWNTDPDLFWAVIATNGNSASDGLPANTVFVTAPDSTTFPNGNPSDPSTTSLQSPWRGAIENVYGQFNVGTPGVNPDATSGLSSTSTSYSQEYANAFSTDFDQAIEQSGNVGAGSDSSDLWELYPGSAANQQQIDINTYTLNSNGVFTAAVPEPSTWASVILGATCLLAFRRRRAQA